MNTFLFLTNNSQRTTRDVATKLSRMGIDIEDRNIFTCAMATARYLAARKELGLATSQTIMIGDTMETDILGGVQMGYRTILTLSGGTKREDLDRYAFGPDVIVESIADLCEPSRFLANRVPRGNQEEDTVTDFRAWRAANA